MDEHDDWRPIGAPAPGEHFDADPRARTRQRTGEVAIVQTVPPDAVQMGLTDLTAPGLALSTNLNPDNERQMRRLRWMTWFMLVPTVLVVLAIVLT